MSEENSNPKQPAQTALVNRRGIFAGAAVGLAAAALAPAAAKAQSVSGGGAAGGNEDFG